MQAFFSVIVSGKAGGLPNGNDALTFDVPVGHGVLARPSVLGAEQVQLIFRAHQRVQLCLSVCRVISLFRAFPLQLGYLVAEPAVRKKKESNFRIVDVGGSANHLQRHLS